MEIEYTISDADLKYLREASPLMCQERLDTLEIERRAYYRELLDEIPRVRKEREPRETGRVLDALEYMQQNVGVRLKDALDFMPNDDA